MRVTERFRLANILEAQRTAAIRLDKATRVAASGSQVNRPSDDPTAYATLIRRNDSLAILEGRSQLAVRAASELDVAQNALSTAVDLMASAREVAVAGSTETADAKARKILAQDITAIRGEMLAVANTRYATKYLFAGTKSDTPPFLANGTFVGNDQVLNVPVLEGVALPATASGARAFTSSAGGRDVLADLDALRVALENDDTAAIRSSLDALEAGHQQILAVQVEAGFSAERFRTAGEVLGETQTVIIEELSKQIQGDPAAQLTELTLARTAYERSVAVTRELLQVTGLQR